MNIDGGPKLRQYRSINKYDQNLPNKQDFSSSLSLKEKQEHYMLEYVDIISYSA